MLGHRSDLQSKIKHSDIVVFVTLMSTFLGISMCMLVRVKPSSLIRSSSRSMASGKLVPISPLGKGIRDGAVDIADYEGQAWPKVPIAIPSKSRESELCEQTLKMLRSYEYDMSKVQSS